MLDRLIKPLAPHHCYNCRQTGSVLCPRCTEDIVMEAFSYCILCTHPTPGTSQLCKSCRKTSPLEDAWCGGWRQGTLKRLIDAYKFEAVKEAAQPLSAILAGCLPELSSITVTEVPTANRHVRRLGYDHARLLAKTLASSSNLPYQPLLERHGQQTQHFSSRLDRQTRAPSLFAPRRLVSGDVLLVDDIATTGSSLTAAAQHLHQAGARQVYVAILARQPLD